jgi:shikimate kinase
MSETKSKTHANFVLPKPVVLVGLMGAGKSTIGRRLSHALDLPFIDADQEIAQAAGCSISDIFEIYGETIFRDLEQRVMLRLVSDKPCIIATGGGAFMNPAVRKIIREKAISLWLKAELDVLLERVSRRDTRPLLKTGDRRSILGRLIEERHPIYAEADITIDSNAGVHEAVVQTALSALEGKISHG